MRNNLIYGLGAGLLIYGCVQQQFKKSALNVVGQVVGFVAMTIAYII